MAGEVIKEVGRSGGIDEDGTRQYERTYRVTNTANDAYPDLVDALVGITWGASYPDDSLATCRSKQVRMTELATWEATYSYSTKQPPADKGTMTQGTGSAPTHPSTPGTNTTSTAPDSRPWVYTWSSVDVEQLLVTDRSDDEVDVVNTAGLPFDPPPSVQDSRTELKIKGFQPISFDLPAKIRAFVNKVNAGTFLGLWPANSVRCTHYSGSTQFEHAAWFWEVDVSLQMIHDEPYWNPVRVANVSTMVRESMSKPYQPIRDKTGNPVTQPVPIDNTGTRPLNADEDIIYLEFAGYYQADFSGLLA